MGSLQDTCDVWNSKVGTTLRWWWGWLTLFNAQKQFTSGVTKEYSWPQITMIIMARNWGISIERLVWNINKQRIHSIFLLHHSWELQCKPTSSRDWDQCGGQSQLVVWYLDLNLLKGARAHYQYSAISQSESGPQVQPVSLTEVWRTQTASWKVTKAPWKRKRCFFLKDKLSI